MSLLNQMQDKLDTLNPREKIMILVTGVILFPGLIDFVLLQPMRDDTTRMTRQTQMITERLTSTNQQQEELVKMIQDDPAMELERRIEGTQSAITQAEQKLLEYTGSLIPPDKMAGMLKSLLDESDSLTLLSLENLAAAPLFDPAQASPNSNTRDVFGLYRHGIKLQFKGDYMSSMNYVAALEKLPWKFYWRSFDYQVEQYPSALVTLNIYTLSTNSYWIGDGND